MVEIKDTLPGGLRSLAPLSGVRVLELGGSLSGPAAGRLLADLGADVIKVEPPGGDPVRKWGILSPDGSSWFFKSHNRGKRLLQLDLRIPEGVTAVRGMVAEYDVLIENFVPGRMTQWGLGYEDLRMINDRLIYVSISGFGQEGPYAERPGYGNVAECVGGIRYITGFPDHPPVRVGVSLADEVAGLYAVVGVLSALAARHRDGHGDHIDVALTESILSITEGVLPEYGATGEVRERIGNMYASAAPTNTYPTADQRWVAIGANSDGFFRRLCQIMGKAHLAEEDRFRDNPSRVVHQQSLDRLIGEWTQTKTCEDVVELLRDAGIPSGPVMSVADVAKDPQFKARGMIASIPDGTGQHVTTPGIVPKFRRHAVNLGTAAGDVGRDSDEILGRGIHSQRPATGMTEPG